MASHSGTLYVIATPIGNLEDLSPRALRLLFEVPLIAAEDTRETLKLLKLVQSRKLQKDLHVGQHHGFPKLLSYHEHNEEERSEELIALLLEGQSIALVSDAGTPAISDPGYRLVSKAHTHQITVVPVPGPSAVTTLLSASGLPTNKFMFVGFLPSKSIAREEEISSWKAHSSSHHGMTFVFYESTRRLKQTFEVLAKIHPQATLTIGRELTKLHEEIHRTPVEMADHWLLSHKSLKGEVAIALHLPPRDSLELSLDEAFEKNRLIKQAQDEFVSGVPLKTVLQKYKKPGIKRSELYALLLEAKNKTN